MDDGYSEWARTFSDMYTKVTTNTRADLFRQLVDESEWAGDAMLQKNRLVLGVWLGEIWAQRVAPVLCHALPEALRRVVQQYAWVALPSRGETDFIPPYPF